MYLKKIGKQERLKKFTSCFLIVLIGILGFPLSVFSSPNPDATQVKPSQVNVTPIEPDKGVVVSGSKQDSSVTENKEHFAIIEEFKIDKGFWFTLFSISELAKLEKGNNLTAFNATPIAFSLTGSGISPTYTIINKGAKVQTVNRDNLTGKLSLPDGKSILTEAINQTLSKLPKNAESRQGDWEENVTISLKEYTGIRSFEVPVRIKTEPIKGDKSLFRISFDSKSFDFNLKSNSSIKQNMKGFAIVGAENKKVYFSVFRYEGDCSQYENGYQSDHFVGQQIGFLANPENGKAILNSIALDGFNQLLTGYPMINLSSGSFRDKESSPPQWMGKVLGMSRLLQTSIIHTADKSSDFAPITTSVGGHIIDGLWSLAFNTSSFLKELATGNRQDAPISEVTNRLFDAKVSFIRNLYDAEKDTQGWNGTGPQIEIMYPSAFECYSKIGGDVSGLPGDLLKIKKDNWALLKRDSQGKYSGIEESVSRIAVNFENAIQKNLWSKNPFGRASIITDGYGRIGQDLIIKQVEVARSIKTENGVGKDLKPVDQNPDNPGDSTEKYITTQTIEYSGKGKQYRTRSINVSAVEKETDNEKKVANYKLWIMGQVLEPKIEDNKSFYGPIEFDRKIENEMVSFKTRGYSLIEEVLNHTIANLKKHDAKKGYWKDKISLDFVGEYLPQYLEFNFESRVVDIGNNNSGLIVKYISEPFTFKSLADNFPIIKAKSVGFFVYSLGKDIMYQHTSKFEAYCDNDSLIVEEFGYLSNQNARPIGRFFDMREEIIFKKEPLMVVNPVELPIWAIQSIMAKQITFTSSIGAAEQKTNPAAALSIMYEAHPWKTQRNNALKTFDEAWKEFLDALKISESLEATNDAYRNFFAWCKENQRKSKEFYETNKLIIDFVVEVGSIGLKNYGKPGAEEIIFSDLPVFGVIWQVCSSLIDLYEMMTVYQDLIEILPDFILAYDDLVNNPPPPSQVPEPIKEEPIKKKSKKPKSPKKTILIIAGLVAAGGIGALLDKPIGESGINITGKWNFEFNLDFRSLGVQWSRGVMTINSDGTIQWPSDTSTWTYTVNGSNIRMELHVPYWKSPAGDVVDANWIFTGEINDENNMSGNVEGIFKWSWATERYYGKWSAKRQ